LLWHISDDGSKEPYLFDIKRDYAQLNFTSTVTNRGGWGKNANKGMVFCWGKSDYIYLNEDDYVPKYDIDLTSGVALLDANKNLGLIRYDGIEGHALDLQLREVQTMAGIVQVMAIAHSSPHLNRYSNRPHLKHRRFHKAYDMYPEGVRLGETEEKFAHRVKNKYSHSPKIAVLKTGIIRAFEHIGHSRQLTELDKMG
jgi:hypothetical protein